MRRWWIGLVLACVAAPVHAENPRINDTYPVNREDLSAPIVDAPIHDCARVVHVSGFIPHALVRVYANGNEVIASENPYFGFADIPLNRALNLGDKITAVQIVGALASAQSPDPVVVGPYPALNKPVVQPDLYACGRIVDVDQLVPSTHVTVHDSTISPPPNRPIGQDDTPSKALMRCAVERSAPARGKSDKWSSAIDRLSGPIAPEKPWTTGANPRNRGAYFPCSYSPN